MASTAQWFAWLPGYSLASPAMRAAQLGLSLALVVPFMLLASSQTAQADTTAFDVWIVGGEVQSESTLRATQGDTVEITYHSDTELKLHLHGYDIETAVKPDVAASMTVEVSSGGRFAIEAHGHGAAGHQTLLYLEVHPR
ncbi:MAG: hypothetical protein VX246_08010 [Myxococcota bacterium]|nr:hypothetical protein [Myxococcota bacterium]